jgi:RNA polymerase sigma-70 factor (ECF subfamily)
MDEAELIRRLQQYDSHAISEVVTTYGAALHRYVAAIVGDYHLGEDLVSETYVRMLERINTYTYTGAPFRAWLYRIAHNLAINAVTRRRPVAGEDALGAIALTDDDPAIAAERHAEYAAVRQAIAQLTDEQQQVILLRFVANQPIAEVAQSLHKSEGAVKQLQLRALRSLGRLLDQAEGEYGR